MKMLLPVTESSSKRVFSILKRRNTCLRNRMGEEKLVGVTLLNILQDIKMSPDRVINHFAKSKSKKN